MKLTATSMRYEHEGNDGYGFTVDVVHDPEWGWDATVVMRASGRETPDAAVKHLRHAAEAFLRALKEMET